MKPSVPDGRLHLREEAHLLLLFLLIGVLGRSDYLDHYAPTTQLRRLLRGVYYCNFYVNNVVEKTACSDPDRVVPKEMVKRNV